MFIRTLKLFRPGIATALRGLPSIRIGNAIRCSKLPELDIDCENPILHFVALAIDGPSAGGILSPVREFRFAAKAVSDGSGNLAN